MTEFVKKHKYIFLNLLMVAITALVLFTQPLSSFAFVALVIVGGGWFVSVPLLISANISAYKAVKRNDEIKGVQYSAIAGFIGGFIAAHTVNKSFAPVQKINLFFIIWIYPIIVYPIMVGILFLIGVYNLF